MRRFYLPLLLLLFTTLFACQTDDVVPTLVSPVTSPLPITPPPTPPITPPAEQAVVTTVPGTATETSEPLATPTSIVPTTVPASPTATGWRIGVEPGVPEGLTDAVQALIEAQAGQFRWADGEPADIQLAINDGTTLATWVYAIAVPFATLDDATTMVDLMQNWRTGSAPDALVTEDVNALLTKLWGTGQAQTVPADELVAQLWQQRPTWTAVPFDQLTPDLKVLTVDGTSPLANEFSPDTYPLVVNIGLTGDEAAVEAFLTSWTGPETNYDAAHITRVAMTGVTALVRATAYQMEIRGLLYPGEEVAPVLQAADVAHISNEVSFVPDCPKPHYIGEPVFCSDARYMELLRELGVDVVELTGNHLNDWSARYMPYTLDLYDEAGMKYFGGGRDLAAAQEPLRLEHNGNRVAFVGCNPVGPQGAWATNARAGSNPCDYVALRRQISQLREEGYLVIVTQQYQEIYAYAPTAQQRADFHILAEAGASAVSGSQGHHAQGFDFHSGSFIHYGLGNLFFDQMDQMGTRQTFVDTYVIYEGSLLSVQLWTGLIENYARPRLMTPEERRDLLQTVFEASGW